MTPQQLRALARLLVSLAESTGEPPEGWLLDVPADLLGVPTVQVNWAVATGPNHTETNQLVRCAFARGRAAGRAEIAKEAAEKDSAEKDLTA